MVRAPFFDKNGLKKGAWSQEEDDKLKAYVERYGHWNWRQLPKFAGLSRCGKSCRLRWLNYLKPGVKLGNFCREEEDLIFKYHEKFGNRWSMIAAKLPGRSDNEVKNYWHTSLKKKLKEYHSNCNCVSSDSQEMVSTVRNTEQEAVVVNVPCHPILESCISSPDQDSCSISTSCCSSSGMILQDQQLPISGNCVSSDSQEMVSTVRNTEQEAVIVNVPCHPILESCISSPDQDSCSISASISASCCSSSGMILQNQQLPISGDFWTEPFIEDKYTFYQDSSADLSSFQDWDLDFVSLDNYPSCDQDTMYAFEFNDNGLF